MVGTRAGAFGRQSQKAQTKYSLKIVDDFFKMKMEFKKLLCP